MDPEKIRAIQEWDEPKPGDVRAVRRFVGFVNYYRRFIQDFGGICRPLYNLIKKNGAPWDDSCRQAFQRLKEEITKAPVMRHFDPKKQSFIEYDASDTRVAGILSQKDEQGQLRPVAYFSTTLNPAESNYSIYDKELMAIIKMLEAFRAEL